MELQDALAAPRVAADAPPKPTISRPAPGVVIVDHLLSEQHRQLVLDFLANGGWAFGGKSSSRKDKFSFWHKHFAGHRKSRSQTPYDCAEELRKNAPLMSALWSHLEAALFRGHTLIRCYANAQTYGSDGSLHTDSKSPTSFTAVYYPHVSWNADWAGETLIFNADKSDVVAAIYPRPNRLAVFHGNMPHVARGVARTCPELRMTLIFKTESNHERPATSVPAGAGGS
jgi:SM-20-related protein